jgi:opacity protein-like surface antigen
MTCFRLLLSLGLAAASATAAVAADFNYGARGVKDYGGLAGVPVPAPVPVVESFKWYVRTDFGYAVKSSGSASVDNTLGLHETHPYDRNEGPFHGSIGFGAYLTRSLRWDVTGDYRGAQKVKSGPTNYIGTTSSFDPVTSISETYYYNVTRYEEVRVANHTGLFNLYYDFNRGPGFNPYIGAGIGIAIREGRTEFTETANCFDTYRDDPSNPPPGFTGACSQPDLRKSGKPTNVNFGLAAALMAGATYEVVPGVLLDAGYRLAWQGGNTSIRPAGSGDLITAGPRTDHEIRAGLRWNVW